MQTTIGKKEVYEQVSREDAIPARRASRVVQRYVDEPINDAVVSEVLQGYERLVRGRGKDGADITMEDLPKKSEEFQKQIEKDNDKLVKPAETKAALAKEFQQKLDEISSQKDEDIKEKIKELSMLYPLIQIKKQ